MTVLRKEELDWLGITQADIDRKRKSMERIKKCNENLKKAEDNFFKIAKASSCFFVECENEVNERGKFCDYHDAKEKKAAVELSQIFQKIDATTSK
jgi:inorganic pyrophosphatase